MLSGVDLATFQADTEYKLKGMDSLTKYDTRRIENTENSLEGLETVAGEFESVFIHMLLKSMRQTVVRDEGMLPVSTGQEIWEDMLDQEISKGMGKERRFGIADAIVNTYRHAVEKNSGLVNLKG